MRASAKVRRENTFSHKALIKNWTAQRVVGSIEVQGKQILDLQMTVPRLDLSLCFCENPCYEQFDSRRG